MVEQPIRNRQVTGSSPVVGSRPSTVEASVGGEPLFAADSIPDTVPAPAAGWPSTLCGYAGQAAANVAPRLGFACEAFHNIVVRGAFGLFYNLMPSSYIDEACGNRLLRSTLPPMNLLKNRS